MKFSIVIPTIRQITMLFECIESFIKHHGKEHEIIVVEDGSDSGTQHLIKQRCLALGVKCLLSQENRGFSKSMNWGIRESTGDIVVSVNNDVLFTRPVLHYILQDFERDPKIGIVGALLFYSNGTIQHGGIFRNGLGFGHRGYQKKYDQAPEIQSQKYLIGVTGAVYAMRKSMFSEVGLFDEDYFISCDDTQYCIRAWEKGWRTFYDPRVQAIHKEGETRGRDYATKVTKGREWLLKENKVQAMFQQWLRQPGRDLNNLDRIINQVNLDYLGLHQMDEPDKNLPQPKEITLAEKKEIESQFKPVKKNNAVKYIGVRRTGAFGDALMATPIIREISKRYPESKIIVATHCPDAFFKNKRVFSIVRSIEQLHDTCEVVFDLDNAYENRPKMSIVDAYAESVFGHKLVDNSLELYSDEDDFRNAFPFLSSINFDRDKVIVIHMAVSWENRTWPRASWMQVIKSLATRGYKIVVIGKGADFRSDLYTNVTNVLERLKIPEIREIIKRAACFVSIDSGMIHVAQTTNTPIVSLFTVADPKFRIVKDEKVKVLVPKSDCRFCLHDAPPPVNFIACRFGTNHCLKEITPVDVITSIAEVIK